MNKDFQSSTLAVSLITVRDLVMCCRGSGYGVHRTKVMLSLHVATISMRVRRFKHKGLSYFISYNTDNDLCGRNVLPTLKLLLCVRKL